MTITFYFDPACPFTWRTSRWVRDVAARRGEPVRWKFLSLAVLNQDKEIPEQYRAGMAWSRKAHRVLAAADQRYGQDAVDRLYSAVGRRVHYEAADRDIAVIRDALAEAHLPADLTDAAEDESLDKVVRASHNEAQTRVRRSTTVPPSSGRWWCRSPRARMPTGCSRRCGCCPPLRSSAS